MLSSCHRFSFALTAPPANNYLLVSIARAFGVAVDSFGSQPEAANKSGPLMGLT